MIKNKHRPMDRGCWEWFDEIDSIGEALRGKNLQKESKAVLGERLRILRENVATYQRGKEELEWEERVEAICRYDRVRQPRMFFAQMRRLAKR